MNVGELFANLSFGELSNLSMGMDGAGTIEATAQPRLVHFANNGMTQLYSRFAHKRDYVKIQVQEDIQRYPLRTGHSAAGLEETTDELYVMDTVAEPFTGNVTKIISVRSQDDPDTTEDEEFNLLLNDNQSNCIVKTVTYDTLYFKEPVAGMILDIEVTQSPTVLSIPVAPSEEIDLHPLLNPALEYYVASRVYASMNGEENAAKAYQLKNQYEELLHLVDVEDLLQNSYTDSHSKLPDRGFL